MSPRDTTRALLRSAVVELVRKSLAADAAAQGATRELLRQCEGVGLESDLRGVLASALALSGGYRG